MKIKVTTSGNFNNTIKTLNNLSKIDIRPVLERYGSRGVSALAAATPHDTGGTANSWYYEIRNTKYGMSLDFCNSNIQNGVPIAIILQYGHGTRTGGYVQGRDYINPAIQPIFDQLAEELWREVTK